MRRLSPGRSLMVCLALLLLAACGGPPTPSPAPPPSSAAIQARPWPEADALFRSDPRWLGADDAYSIDLGDDRTLWLFGDTFVSTSILNTRILSTMIRNSVGLQTGRDPSNASMTFYWRTIGGQPRSFFPGEGETWFWPGHGLLVEGRLIILFMATRPSSEGLGFAHTGWRAVSIPNPDQPPAAWQLDWLETPTNPFGLIVSGSVLRQGEQVLAYSVREPEHTIHLVRWPVERFAQGDLSQPQWWDGEDRGWVPQQDLREAPQALFAGGQTEFSVHYEPTLDRFLEIQTIGFGPVDLGFRLGDSPVGPWTPLETFYRPEEYGQSRILIYAAKAHPQLAGADLVLTYATNTYPYARLVLRNDLYYPRFLGATFASGVPWKTTTN
jgi:hypothetical protein